MYSSSEPLWRPLVALLAAACTPATVTTTGATEGQACGATATCSSRLVCRELVCRVACNAQPDCRATEICDDGACRPRAGLEGDACEESDDCEEGLFCFNGDCSYACNDHDDCNPLQRCITGRCRDGTSTCGDGITDPGEECDDGDEDNANRCDNDCVANGCDCVGDNCDTPTPHASFRCASGDIYWFDACDQREDLKEACCDDCSGTTCNAPQDNAWTACDDDDRYWFDSCGNRGALAEACCAGCGSDTCSPNDPRASFGCYDDDLYYFDSCGDVGELAQTCCAGCAANACLPPVSHDSRTCNGGDAYWVDSCGNQEDLIEACCAGCTLGTCDTPASQVRLDCDAGDVYWFDACDQREEMHLDCEGNGCVGEECNPAEWQLIPADGEWGEEGGTSVAVSGDTIIVGLKKGTPDGSNQTGTAIVWVRDGVTWTEQQKLIPSNGADLDEFGSAVAIDGDRAVVGARWADDAVFASGLAYVFERTGTTWTETARLDPAGASMLAYFGSSVAIAGDRLFVGAPLHDEPGSINVGAAFLYEWDTTTWQLVDLLLASDGEANDLFGSAVAMVGNYLVVGAPGDAGGGASSGSAYLFYWNGSFWAEEAGVTPSDHAGGQEFGTSVSTFGDIMVIGAPGDQPVSGYGAAYVWRWSGSAWDAEGKLVPGTTNLDMLAGTSVAAGDDVILVGVPNGGPIPWAGQAVVFTWDGSTWSETDTLDPSDGAQFDGFGQSVAVGADVAVVGAPGFENDSRANMGAAYVYPLP